MHKLYEPLAPLSKVLLTMHSQLGSGGGHCLTNILRWNMHVDVEPTHSHVQHAWSWLPRKEGHSPADIYQRLSEVLISGQVYNFGIGWGIMDVIYATLLSHIRSPVIWWAPWAEMSSWNLSAAFQRHFVENISQIAALFQQNCTAFPLH